MIYYALGSSLLTNEELRSTRVIRQAYDLRSAIHAGHARVHKVTLPTGELRVDMVATGISTGPDTAPIPWEPIGLGKPLTIQIREVYTGKSPSGVFGRDVKKPMLLTTAVKSIATY